MTKQVAVLELAKQLARVHYIEIQSTEQGENKLI